MSVNSISNTSSLMVQSLVNMRAQLDDLQRQLGTGKKSDTYAGIGLNRGLTVGLRAQLSAIGGYGDTIGTVATRISLAQTSLGRMSDIGRGLKSTILQSTFDPDTSGKTTVQKTAQSQLDELLGLLNSQVGDHYLFSGRNAGSPAVETTDHILNGDGSRAGLKQLIDQRNQADLGASGLGRLDITAPSATSIAIDEDAVSPFGFKLASVGSTLSNAVVTGPSGTPANVTIDLTGGNPSAGNKIQFQFTLPDGTSENITLTATASSTPGANEFTIGGSAAATATNLKAALTTAVGKLATSSLAAASTLAASNDFFNIDDANPPQRVDGPPYDLATQLIDGTSSNTVSWYIGEGGSDSARSTAGARVDQSLNVAYGVRANEQGIRWVVQNVAALAASDFSTSDPDAAARSSALNSRMMVNLDTPAGIQKIATIQADLAGAQTTLDATKTRHQQVNSTLSDLLQNVEGVPQEQVGAEILALQTTLQASMQTTAMLYQTSLINYLK